MHAIEPYIEFLLVGAIWSFVLSLVAFPLSVGLGLVLVFGRVSTNKALQRIASVYISIFRSLPEILVILALYFGANRLIAVVNETFGIDAPLLIPLVAAICALTIQFAAYAAELFRDAHRSINTGLIEAGYAIGMTSSQVRIRILTPLMLRAALPSLGNLFLVLIKVSALASVIGVEELTRRSDIVSGATREPMITFSFAALIYLLFAAAGMVVQHYAFGKRYGREGRSFVH